MRRTLFALCLAGSTLLPSLAAQSARDVFWSASDLVSVAANPAGKKATHSAAPQHKAPSARETATVRGNGSAHIAPQLVAQNGYGEQPHFVRASLQTQQIGLRYSLLLEDEKGNYREVSSDTVFHAGEKIRLSMMSNEPGFLYVITQGSSGSWSPIFPGANTAANANRVEAGQVYQVPSDPQAFKFDATPGTEKLFVVLSRERISDLDSAIQRLKTPASVQEAPQPAAPGAILEASNRIPDDLVRKLASRDLTLVTEQKVDQKGTASVSGEKAVYVVAKQEAGSSSHEVVASILLNHQ